MTCALPASAQHCAAQSMSELGLGAKVSPKFCRASLLVRMSFVTAKCTVAEVWISGTFVQLSPAAFFRRQGKPQRPCDMRSRPSPTSLPMAKSWLQDQVECGRVRSYPER